MSLVILLHYKMNTTCTECKYTDDSNEQVCFYKGLCFECFEKQYATYAKYDDFYTYRLIEGDKYNYKVYFVNGRTDGVELLDTNGVLIKPQVENDILLIGQKGRLILHSNLPDDVPQDFLDMFEVVDEDTHIPQYWD